MKKLLVFCLLAAGPVSAQTWKNPLPVDSANGRVAYYGTVFVKGVSAQDLYARAKATGATILSAAPTTDELTKQVAGVSTTTVQWAANGRGRPESRGLRFGLVLKASEGSYSYEITDLANVSNGAQYVAAPGVVANVPSQSAPIEKVLANPNNYDRKHLPTANYQAYTAAVNSAINDVISRVKEGMSR